MGPLVCEAAHMRTLVLADARPYPPLRELLPLHVKDLEAVICLGDLTFYDLLALETLDLPKFGVYGNHCIGTYLQRLGIQNVHDQAVQLPDGRSLIGLEGCPPYKKSPFCYPQERASEIIAAWPRCDIVISHSPPYGIHDDSDEPDRTSHHGWHGLRHYIETQQPQWVLHGHTHPDPDWTQLGQTQIVHTWRWRIIDL